MLPMTRRTLKNSGVPRFFCKQTAAYEIRPRDWSSDVCSSDLPRLHVRAEGGRRARRGAAGRHRRGRDRKSVVEGKRVDLGGGRIIKKKTEIQVVLRLNPHPDEAYRPRDRPCALVL